MDEYFLQFLWKYQKFTRLPLHISTGETVSVLEPGFHNHNAGPDFSEAKIKIDSILWSGSVEIHYRASDWLAHKHQNNPNYENVILHVVWINDIEIENEEGQKIPTLVLANFIDSNLEKNYRTYINQPKTIRCDSYLANLPDIQITSMLDHALTDRLETKSGIIRQMYLKANNDWEETTYQLLGKNFGFSLNKEPFEKLTSVLPYRLIAKHLDQPKQVMALIFGAAGFLDDNFDDYQKGLKEEYSFLSKKYNLDSPLTRHQWKFSKLRPANFPTVRLAQFAEFLLNNNRLFSYFIELKSLAELKVGLQISPKDYWLSHYDFGKKLKTGNNHFGADSMENILINTATPLLAAYGKFINEDSYVDLAMNILSSIKAEENRITKAWKSVGVGCLSAFDSQALIQQYNEFCIKKKCLQCNIGVAILHR